MSVKSQSRFFNFNFTDIVIVTPSQIANMRKYVAFNRLGIGYVIFDEAVDTLNFTGSMGNMMQTTLNDLGFNNKEPVIGAKKNDTKIILTSSINTKDTDLSHYKSLFSTYFKEISILKAEDSEVKDIQFDHQIIQIDLTSKNRKLDILYDKLIESSHDKFIVLASENDDVYDIQSYLQSKKIDSVIMTDDQPEERGLLSILSFKANEVQVLISKRKISPEVNFYFSVQYIQYDIDKSFNKLFSKVKQRNLQGKKDSLISFITLSQFSKYGIEKEIVESATVINE